MKKVVDFIVCFKKGFMIFILSFLIPFIVSLYVDVNMIGGFMVVGFVSVLSVLLVSFMYLSKDLKKKIFARIVAKFHVK